MTGKQSDTKAMSGHLTRYLEVLGLPPGASLDEVSTTYLIIIKRFPANPTEEEEARMQELKHAYDMLRRSYVPKQAKTLTNLFDRRYLAPVGIVAAVLMTATLVMMNYSTIKMKMIRYEPGEVLRLKTQMEPYGQVVGFEPHHAFPTGNPSSAYAIRLQGNSETVWISERLVVNGMIPTAAK